ncbi:MAG TPA: pyroglutamyl-peptidase I [Roseiarcus sp.]|nr:pyroglutamyl-peptidase I [Roseiarcus sp.]
MSSAARTILVTGFEPFGGETVNASWEAAQRLEGWRHGEYAAAARLLPCAYDASVKQLVRAIETLQPDALLMTGQAARRGVVCVERFAHNLDAATAPDNDGVLRRGIRIVRDAPDWLETAAPVTAIVRAIREAGIPARASTNAGGFVCNHLYFGALDYLRRERRAVPAIFVHLPATPEQTLARANARRLPAEKAADALRAAAGVIALQREAAQ